MITLIAITPAIFHYFIFIFHFHCLMPLRHFDAAISPLRRHYADAIIDAITLSLFRHCHYFDLLPRRHCLMIRH
jgi:hypothetical protein